MNTLNLLNPEHPDSIDYKVSKFPDGQQSVEILTNVLAIPKEIAIHSRLNSFLDLELIICATQALRNKTNNDIEISLYVPYFLGARSDRKFSDGGVNYLKEVICPIINSQNFHSVTVLDPHSDVLEACINNYKSNKPLHINFLQDALRNIDNTNDAHNRICLISPDAGAYKKVFDVAKMFGIQNVVTASKVRDIKTGQILRTEINLGDELKNPQMKFMIIDDICDGGRTFIELSKAIKEQLPNAEIYLVVTHGIFSAGLDVLKPHFAGIFTTNSYKDIETDNSFLHQFNAFKFVA
jgi:ribose-phosphate pyrophosphokinase